MPWEPRNFSAACRDRLFSRRLVIAVFGAPATAWPVVDRAAAGRQDEGLCLRGYLIDSAIR